MPQTTMQPPFSVDGCHGTDMVKVRTHQNNNENLGPTESETLFGSLQCPVDLSTKFPSERQTHVLACTSSVD